MSGTKFLNFEALVTSNHPPMNVCVPTYLPRSIRKSDPTSKSFSGPLSYVNFKHLVFV